MSDVADENENGPGASRAVTKEEFDHVEASDDGVNLKGTDQERHLRPRRDRPSSPASVYPVGPLEVLARVHRWLVWKFDKNGKTAKKPPVNARGYPADEKAVLLTLEEARKRAARLKLAGSQGGIGILAGGPLLEAPDKKPVLPFWLGYMDLDNCRKPESGEIDAWARKVVEKFNSYTEVSPSGIGLKIFFLHRMPPDNPGDDAKEPVEGEKNRGYELRFTDARYSTVTGEQFEKYDQLNEVEQAVFDWVEDTLRPDILKKAAAAKPRTTGGKVHNKVAPVADERVAALIDAFIQRVKELPDSAHARKLAELADAMLMTPLPAHDYEDWKRYLMAVYRHFKDGTQQLLEAAKDLIHVWSQTTTADNYSAKAIEDFWKNLVKKNGASPAGSIKPVTIKTIFKRAREAGWKPKQDSKQDTLLSIIEGIELFHDDDSNAFADLTIDGHRETWPVRSTYFKRWLRGMLYDRTGSAVDDKTETIVIKTAEAKAFKGKERKVYLRIANTGDAIYHDRGDKDWRVAKITADGWEMVDAPEVRFTRMKQMRALPEPVRGGSVDELRPLLNVDDTGFLLTKGWMLGALRGLAPYVILGIVGEQGTAKSTYSRLLRYLIDPYDPPLRNMPSKEDDLFIAAFRQYVVTFNNVSYIDNKLSDDLCQISVDGGYGKRMLFTDTDEVLLKDRRPVIINSITNVYTRPDFLDRSIILTLDYIPDDKRREEEEINKDFAAVQARVLGALYDILSDGLKRLADTKLTEKPRMADFAKWVVACLGDEAEPFMAAYMANRDDAQHELLEGDVVANAVIDLARNPPQHPFRHNEKQTKYRNLTALLRELSGRVEKDVQWSKSWPRSGKRLDDKLKRLAPSLRKDGVIFIKHGKSNGEMAVELYSINTDVKSKTNLGSEPPPLADDYGDAIPENQHAPASGRRDDPNDPNTPM